MTTVSITCDVSQPDGTEFLTARLEFALSGTDYDTAAGEAIPAVTTYVDLDAAGQGEADLWPVDLGARNTFYAVVLRASVMRDGRTSEFVSTLGRIQPQSSGGQDLADLLAQSSGGIVVGSTIYDTLADAVAAAVAAGAAGADPVAALAAAEAAEASRVAAAGHESGAQTAQAAAEVFATGAAIAAEAAEASRVAAAGHESGAQTAQAAAEVFATGAAVTAGFYDTIALGRAAVADGATFGVLANGSDGLARATIYRRDSSTTQTLITSVVPGSEVEAKADTSALRRVSSPLAYTSPPAVNNVQIGTTTPTVSGLSSALRNSLLWNDPAKAPGIPAFVTLFEARFDTAETGRTIEFVTADAAQKVLWRSGPIAAAASGTVSHPVPVPSEAYMPADGFVGFYTNATGANGVYCADSGGPAVGQHIRSTTSGRFNVGQTYVAGSDGFAAATEFIPALRYEVIHEAALLQAAWYGQPNGPVQLGEDGRIAVRTLPLQFGGQGVVSAANGAVETVAYDPDRRANRRVIERPRAASIFARVSPDGNAGTNSTYPQNKVHIGWTSDGTPGFEHGGMLTRLLVPPGGAQGSSPKIQAWIVRPRATPPSASGATIGFDLVAQVGEITAAANEWRDFGPLAIEVEAGDMAAFRGINTGLRYGTGSTKFENDYFIEITVADTSIDALAAGISGVVQVPHRRLDYEATIVRGVTLPALLRREADGSMPLDIYRAPDLPWAGRKIVAVGTSIEAGFGAANYLSLAAQWHQAQFDNQAVGSSGIVWDGARALSLGATQAELTAAGFAPAQSYEVKLLGKGADLYHFGHCYNDRTMPLGTITSTDRSTFYGAYNAVITELLADNPDARMCFVGAPSVYTPTGQVESPDSLGRNGKTLEKIEALRLIAEKWGSPFLDMSRVSGCNVITSVSGIYQYDNIHPNSTLNLMMARIIYDFWRQVG